MIFMVVVDCTSWLTGLAWISDLRLRGWGSNWASFVKIKRNKGLIAWFYLSRALINKGTTEHSELAWQHWTKYWWIELWAFQRFRLFWWTVQALRFTRGPDLAFCTLLCIAPPTNFPTTKSSLLARIYKRYRSRFFFFFSLTWMSGLACAHLD